jgi:hypothetical protein
MNENIDSNPNSPLVLSEKKIPIAKSGASPEETTSEKEISPHRVLFKDRFAFAIKQQSKREQERINKIKHNPRHSMLPEEKTISKDEMYHSPTQKDFTDKFRQGLATPNILWSDAIRKLQENQEKRNDSVRSTTTNYAKQVDTFQVASKRINQWEDKILYEPTALELASTWQKVRGYLQLPPDQQETYIQESHETQAMILGAVKVMSLSSDEGNIIAENTKEKKASPDEISCYLREALRPPTKYIGLRASVQQVSPCNGTTNSTSTTAVPLKVIAMVCRLSYNVDNNAFAIFLVSSPFSGYTEEDISYQYLQQPLQLKLYMPNSDNKRVLFTQREIQVLPTESQAALRDVMIEDFPISDIYGDDNLWNVNSTEEEIQKMILIQGGEVCSPEIRAMTRKLSQMGARVDHTSSYNEEEEKDQEIGIMPLTPEPAKICLESAFSSPFQTVEGELPTSISPMIEYSAHSPKKAWIESSSSSSTLSSAQAEMNTDTVMTLDTVCTASVPSQAFINLNLNKIAAVSCTEKLFLAHHQQPVEQVTIVTHALKTVQTDANCVAVDNRIFELSRGVAISGMISKLPTSSNGWGKAQRRFFVLKDNILGYFTSRPHGDVFNPDLRPKRFYTITEETKIEECNVGGMRKFWKISFVSSQVVYWHFKPRPVSADGLPTKGERWMNALRQAIDMQRKKRETIALTLKTWYFHESNDFHLIAVDAAKMYSSLGDGPHQYMRVALFRTSQSYFVDIITASQEKFQLELLRTNEQPLFSGETASARLHALKIYGDKLLFAGDMGSVFVGVMGRTTGVSLLESGKRVLYCVAALVPNQQELKKEQADFRFLACEASMNLFVACDVRNNACSFWQLDCPDVSNCHHDDALGYTSGFSPLLDSPSKKRPGFYYHIRPEFQSQFFLPPLPQKGSQEEKILTVQFLSEQQAGYLLIGTNYRLLLLLVTAQEKELRKRKNSQESTRSHNSRNGLSTEVVLGVSSYVLLDEIDVTSSQIGAFGVQVGSSETSVASSHSRISLGMPLSLGANSSSNQFLSDLNSSNSGKIILWRLVQDYFSPSGRNTEDENKESVRLCHVVRKEIDRDSLQELVCRALPV